ncbi:MAG: hypothetical protein Q9187_003415 [Circinaria calcarea]
MIPRISVSLPVRLLQESRSSHAVHRTCNQASKLSVCPFSSTSHGAASSSSTKKQRQRYQDPYAERQSRARRLANISRQEVLRQKRAEALGDPIRGIPTPFVESFDTGLLPTTSTPPSDISPEITTTPVSPSPTDETPSPSPTDPLEIQPALNHLITPAELASSLSFSRHLTQPYRNPNRALADPTLEARQARQHVDQDATAREAVSRIVSLATGSSRDRTRANIQRCIATFGRHNTDAYLRPRPKSAAALDPARPKKPDTPRAGPDTGSSEVQIGILTARIRVLANEYEGDGKGDKVNKRNLRLLLHRRQRLLRYMQKRERGSGRWEHMLEALGLTEANWKGQIDVP